MIDNQELLDYCILYSKANIKKRYCSKTIHVQCCLRIKQALVFKKKKNKNTKLQMRNNSSWLKVTALVSFTDM